jgi:peroxiredoxin
LETQNRSPELWKQVDENLIRLSPPHTFTTLAAYDWVTAHINLKDAEALIASEIEWMEGQPRPTPPQRTLSDLIDQAQFGARLFGPLCTLASAQIQMKDFDGAHATIARIHTWLNGDFKLRFDQDPLETFPDYGAKEFSLSAQLEQAEGKTVDALAFWQQVITNPYFRREYGGHVNDTRALWKQLGGTEEGWAAFSRVPALPADVPAGYLGTSFPPWFILDYKLPEMKLPGLDSRTWTKSDFEGKSTLVYLWAAWCGPCWVHLPAIQAIHNATKDRRDIQVVTLSVDEDQEKLSAFMKDKGYTFPVMVGKAYAEKLLPKMIVGQTWIVDKTAAIRLQRSQNVVVGRGQAEVDEGIYKLLQVSKH